MKIVILPSARNDLAEGFRFYEEQEEGLGGYLSNHSCPILIRCESTRAFTGKNLDSTDCSPNGFRTQFTTRWIPKLFSSEPPLIAEEIRNGADEN